MDRQSVERLRFDRRLKTREGWLDATAEGEYLDALPDVSEKMTTCAAEEDATESAADEVSAQYPSERQPELEPQSPAPVAGDFSTQRSQSAAAPSDTPPAQSAATEPVGLPDQGSAGTFRSEVSRSEGGLGGDSNSN
jgi:hypothetical protein